MIVRVHNPGAMDAEKLPPTQENLLLEARPRRYSRSQRKVSMIPFGVFSVDGSVSDQGYIVVDIRTGRLSIDHRVEEVAIDE